MHLIGSYAHSVVAYALGSSLSFQGYKTSSNQQPGTGFVWDVSQFSKSIYLFVIFSMFMLWWLLQHLCMLGYYQFFAVLFSIWNNSFTLYRLGVWLLEYSPVENLLHVYILWVEM